MMYELLVAMNQVILLKCTNMCVTFFFICCLPTKKTPNSAYFYLDHRFILQMIKAEVEECILRQRAVSSTFMAGLNERFTFHTREFDRLLVHSLHGD